MAVYEDPIFVKALKHLHSPAKDSTLQIFNLLEEALNAKYGGTKFLNPKYHNLPDDSTFTLEAPKHRGPSPALHIASEKSSRSSTPPSEPLSIKTSPDRDDDDLPLEIFEDDLFCTVCKGIRVTSDNRLLECNDCHSLYHQECHKPPVDNEANDPRFVWSCGDCTKKSLEKLSTKPKSSSSESSKKHKSDADSESSSSKKHKSDADIESSSSSSKKHKSDSEHVESSSKKHKSDGEKGSSSSKSSHKRSDKSEKSSSSSGHKSSHGSSKPSSSSSSSSKSDSRSSSSSNKSSGSNLNFNKQPGSPNSKAPSCKANIIAADRRLQNMKKKAAAKMQEKRSNPK